MSNFYKMRSEVHTSNPKTIDKLIHGQGLMDMILDKMKMSEKQRPHDDNPFSFLSKNDFNDDDLLVKSFFESMNGYDGAKRVFSASNAKEVLSNVYESLVQIRLSEIRQNIRVAYTSLQEAIDPNNDAVKMERIASKSEYKSAGFRQIEALKAIDSAINLSLTTYSRDQFINARNNVISGVKSNYKVASTILKRMFDDLTPTENRRVAYTSLSTQNNEPYLLCPKGNFQGKGAVPMEISKCRDNCIDSRVGKDGSVSCAYQDWLKVAFQTHDQVMSRLDVQRHADNEENLLNLNEGERSKPLKDNEKTYEERFEEAKDGINKNRGKLDYTTSREKQLSDNNSVYEAYRNDAKSKNELKKIEETPFENQLPHKLASSKNNIKGSDVMNILAKRVTSGNEFDEEYDDFRQSFLNKKAKKQEDLSFDSKLEETRINDEYTESIESLLDSDEDWGHQFSDDDLKSFADELGLDSRLEDLRD